MSDEKASVKAKIYYDVFALIFVGLSFHFAFIATNQFRINYFWGVGIFWFLAVTSSTFRLRVAGMNVDPPPPKRSGPGLEGYVFLIEFVLGFFFIALIPLDLFAQILELVKKDKPESERQILDSQVDEENDDDDEAELSGKDCPRCLQLCPLNAVACHYCGALLD